MCISAVTSREVVPLYLKESAVDERIREGIVNIDGEQNYNKLIIDMISFSYDASENAHFPLCAVWAETSGEGSVQ
jgi:hypothetical protein